MTDSLKDRVMMELKDAMRGGDKVRLATLRLISAAFKDREIQNRGTGKDESLSEAGMQEILVRMIKQRRESAETYEKGAGLNWLPPKRQKLPLSRSFCRASSALPKWKRPCPAW
jgi:uncharacterized protein YqeY